MVAAEPGCCCGEARGEIHVLPKPELETVQQLALVLKGNFNPHNPTLATLGRISALLTGMTPPRAP